MVEITRELKDEIRRRAASGDYTTMDAYLRDAMAALERAQSIEALLDEGLETSDDPAPDDEIESTHQAAPKEPRGKHD